MISYQPLRELLTAMQVPPRAYLLRQGFASATISKLQQDKTVTTETLDKLCQLFDCQPGDLIKYVP